MEFLPSVSGNLIMPEGVTEVVEQLRAGMEATGLPSEQFAVSPLVAIPIPISEVTRDRVPERFPGLDAKASACPLFWMPYVLSQRFPVTSEPDEDGRYLLEDNDEYALRIALHMSFSRLFDIETGLWVNMHAHLGLDPDDPATLTRVQRWLDGGADQELDAADVSEIFRIGTRSLKDSILEVTATARGSMGALWTVARFNACVEFAQMVQIMHEAVSDHGMALEPLKAEADLTLIKLRGALRSLEDDAVDEIIEEARENIAVCDSVDDVFGFALAETVSMITELIAETEEDVDAILAMADEQLLEIDPSLADGDDVDEEEDRPGPRAE